MEYINFSESWGGGGGGVQTTIGIVRKLDNTVHTLG